MLLNALNGEEAADTGEAGQLWHRLDSVFRQPRAYVRVVLATPVIRRGGPLASESTDIMTDILYKVREVNTSLRRDRLNKLLVL